NQTVDQSIFDKNKLFDKYEEQTTLKQTGVIASNSKQEENVVLFGVTAETFIVPNIIEGSNYKNNNELVVDSTLKDKEFHVGDQLTLSQSEEKLKIIGFSESTKYNASPVLFSNNKTIEKINPTHTNDKTNAIVVKDSN